MTATSFISPSSDDIPLYIDWATVRLLILVCFQLLDCKCIQGPDGSTFTSSATDGYCPTECTMFFPFVVVLGLAKMVFATSRAGSVLIGVR